MARAGRKRKARGYTPGNKPVNEPKEQKQSMTPEMVDRRAKTVGAKNIHAWDGTLVHALVLRGELEHRHLSAARKMESLIKQVKVAIGTPKEPGQRATGTGDAAEDEERFKNLMTAYDLAVISIGPVPLRRAFTNALNDKVCEVNVVRVALDNLAEHFGFDE